MNFLLSFGIDDCGISADGWLGFCERALRWIMYGIAHDDGRPNCLQQSRGY
jgi:hypothetical protein